MNLAAPIRTALLAASPVATLLPTYLGAKAVFTRRPLPAEAPYPCIIVSPDVMNEDTRYLLAQPTPRIVRDIAVYGQNDTSEHYRAVEDIAYAVQALFDRNWRALTVPGYRVTDIFARGPMPAPTDDDKTVGRVVSLTVQLAES